MSPENNAFAQELTRPYVDQGELPLLIQAQAEEGEDEGNVVSQRRPGAEHERARIRVAANHNRQARSPEVTNGQDWAYLMRQGEFRQTKFTHSLINHQ